MTKKQDQNFDNLSSRFRKNIYNTAKGQIRLKVLWRDLLETIPGIEEGGFSILDAGAGQGNFALLLAQKQHHLTLCDISAIMLEDATELFKQNGLDKQARFIHSSVQELSKHLTGQYDVMLFHAVLEWLANPRDTLQQLLSFVKPGGYLSLMFYSRTGLVYQNLVMGNFDNINNQTLAGEGKTLTPTNPQDPDDVQQWLNEFGLKVLCTSGVRVFYDGISRERRKQISHDELYELELEFSRQQPYCALARYVHVVCQKQV